MRENGKLRQYEGGYTDYAMRRARRGKKRRRKNGRERRGAPGWQGLPQRRMLLQDRALPPAQTRRQAGKGQRTRGPQKLKFTYKEQKDYETIEADMAKLEEQIAALDQAIEASASDFVKLNQLMAEKEEAETALEEKMERWMYLEELAAKIAEQ